MTRFITAQQTASQRQKTAQEEVNKDMTGNNFLIWIDGIFPFALSLSKGGRKNFGSTARQAAYASTGSARTA